MENKIDFEINNKEVEKHKDRIRDIWEYKKVDRIPLGIYIIDNNEEFSRQEIEKEKEKNLKFDLNSIKKSLKLLKDDYIPFIKSGVGRTTITSILGCKVEYTELIDNYSTVKSPIVLKIENLDRFHIPISKKEISIRG